MAASTTEITKYPFASPDGLSVDLRYKELQKHGPIRVQLPVGESCWLATRYEDAKMVYFDRRFGRRAVVDHDPPSIWPMLQVKDPTLLGNMDPPEHTRIRRLASGAFTPARAAESEGWIGQMIEDLLDDMAAKGEGADFCAFVGSKLPILVLTKILGVDGKDVDRFRYWVDIIIGADTPPEKRAATMSELEAFINELIAVRREHNAGDLLSILVNARDEKDRLSEQELRHLVLALWLGGSETTYNQLGTTVYTLMTHAHLWQELVDNPDLLPAAMDELWRWIPSFKYGTPFARWASEDVELSDGVIVRAGESVLAEHAVANRDERIYPNGWELDFHRIDPAPHLSFITGAHTCMGMHMAKREVGMTIAALLRRFPKLRLAVAPEAIHWSQATMLRSVEALPLSW
jgi:cytochrome P450 RapN